MATVNYETIGKALLGTASVAVTAYGFAKGMVAAELLGIVGDLATFYLAFQ